MLAHLQNNIKRNTLQRKIIQKKMLEKNNFYLNDKKVFITKIISRKLLE